MSAEAVSTILRSAAPGQYDVVLENLQKISKKQVQADATKKEHDARQCIGLKENVSHPLAAPLKEKLEAYQSETFSSKRGVKARVAITQGDESYMCLINTYAEKIDVSNQYTGAWKATWVVASEENDVAELSGTVSLHTFSYEDGNTQLRTNKEFETIEVSAGGDGLAAALVDQIVEWEHEVLGLLVAMNDFVSDNLRDIRRILPITKTKMKWDVVAHRNVKTLSATKPKKR